MKKSFITFFTSEEKVATFATFFFVFWLMVVNDVFGLEKETRNMSHDIANRFVAPFYPRNPDKIKVILFDDESSDVFPISYRTYASLMSAVVHAQPKVVFLDINFQTRENQFGKSRLLDVLTFAKDHNITIYAAINNKTDEDIKKLVTSVAVGWEGFGDFYPPHNSNYNQPLQTVAFRIYLDYFAPPQDFKQKPLFIYWPYAFSHDSGFISQLIQGFSLVLSWKENKTVETAYFDSFSAQDFTAYSQINQKKIVQKNVVMIGSSVELANDKVRSPIYGQTPGVYLHAAALDNLIKFKSDYYKDEEADIKFKFAGSGSLIEWGVLLINLLIFIHFERIKGSLGAENENKQKSYSSQELQKLFKTSFIYTLLSTTIIVLSFLWSFSYLRVDPGNFIGLFTVNLMIYEFMIYGLLFLRILIIQFPKKYMGELKK